MFSIQFCVCFYSILYICQSHFAVNINKNITKEDENKMETNLDTINTPDEAIILKNTATVENLAENVSKIHVGVDNRRKTNEKNKCITIIDESLLKKNYSISRENLTLNDSSNTDKQQIITGKMVEPADYFENKTAIRIKIKLIEVAPKDNRVEEQNTTDKNDITTEILQNNVNLTTIYKNNVDMTKILQNYENMTKIAQINDNITEKFQKNNYIPKAAEENGFLKNVESNTTTLKSENDDTTKKVKKLDIGIPGQVTNDYNSQGFQNHAKTYDIYKNIKNYDMPKNIQQYDPRKTAQKHEMTKKVYNLNNNKPYYQNYEIKYINIIDKTDMLKKDKSKRFYDDNQKVAMPQIQARVNNELVKKSLDEFTMVRRKTHFTMPDIPIRNDISKREIERYREGIVIGKMVEPADYFENKTASRIKIKLIEGAPKNNRVEQQNTTDKNDITTEILQNNVNLSRDYKKKVDRTKILQNYNNMTKIAQINDKITENFQKINDLLKTGEENGFPMNVESNTATNKSKNDDSPKKVKKRDIGMPGQVPNNYNPQNFQNHDERNYQNYDIYKYIENYDMPKNIEQYDPRHIAQKPEMAKKVYYLNDYRPNYQNYEIKYKNIIDKTDMPKKDERTRFYDEFVKNSLDEFTMVRRKTHFTIPDIPTQNDISEREIERYQDLHYNPKFYEYYDEELNYYTKYIPNNAIYPPDQEKDHIINPVYEEMDSMPNKYGELNKILGRQKEIIRELTKLQIRKLQQSDFEKLMKEVENKQKSRKYTKFEFDTTTRITTKSTTAKKPTTILTLFDETEIRLALKKDPNVRRVLKLGNLKREKYLKRVKGYLERRRNYTTSPDYKNFTH